MRAFSTSNHYWLQTGMAHSLKEKSHFDGGANPYTTAYLEIMCGHVRTPDNEVIQFSNYFCY